jgi:hypothetical protein
LQALMVQVRLVRRPQQSDDDGDSIQSQSLADCVVDQVAKNMPGCGGIVEVCGIGAHDKGWLVLSRQILQEVCLAHAEGYGIPLGHGDGTDRPLQIFDPRKEAWFIMYAVVRCHLKALAIRPEKAV